MSKLLTLQIIFYITCGINSSVTYTQENNHQKMKFFNKKSNSCEQKKDNFEKKIKAKISAIADGKTNHPRIIKYLVKQYSQDLIELAIWSKEQTNSIARCEYKDEQEALEELQKDAERIAKDSEFSSRYAEAAHLCSREWQHNQTSACKNLAHVYDSFRFYSQGIPEIRKIQSIDRQINVHYDEKHTVSFLEKAKKRLQEDLKKIDTPLFNSLKKSDSQYSINNNPSYFESLSQEEQKALTNIIEDVVCEHITDFDKLAEEFQKIFYVFHEKASRKHLNEKKALKELDEDVKRIRLEKENYHWYSATSHLCELERSDNKTPECKQLAQAYKNLRSYSSMHEIKKRDLVQKQINAHSSDKHTILFLKEEKEKLEQEIKNHNNGIIPGSIPSYFDSLSEEDQIKLTNIIKNAIRKKTKEVNELAEEFQKIFDVFREKL